MLSIARSRISLMTQFAFLTINAFGLLLAAIYNSQTQDLYPNNSHHKIGWIATAVMSVQALIQLIGRLAGATAGPGYRREHHVGGHNLISSVNYWRRLSTQDHAAPADRLSNDSGQGTEPGTESLRSNSVSTLDDEEIPLNDQHGDYHSSEAEAKLLESAELPVLSTNMLVRKAQRVVVSWLWAYLDFIHRATDRIILPLGFIALTTGIVTFGRLFVSF